MNYGLSDLALAVSAGLVLGFFYFGMLWLTVRRIFRSRRPQVLLVLSFWLRITITLSGFYLIMAGSWQRLLACLLGFLIVRQIMVRQLGPEREYLSVRTFTR